MARASGGPARAFWPYFGRTVNCLCWTATKETRRASDELLILTAPVVSARSAGKFWAFLLLLGSCEIPGSRGKGQHFLGRLRRAPSARAFGPGLRPPLAITYATSGTRSTRLSIYLSIYLYSKARAEGSAVPSPLFFGVRLSRERPAACAPAAPAVLDSAVIKPRVVPCPTRPAPCYPSCR
eukprot:scaffold58946_cov63-Phaeocystis_antarctica.AAC.2